VHEALLVRLVEPPGELDGDVEDGLRGVEAARTDRVVEAAAVDVLGEDERQSVEAPHVVAADDVGMEAEVDPGLRLALEEIGAAPGLEDRGGHFDGEVEVPARCRTHGTRHAALPEHALHFIEP
jgi:hypothetical protein